MKMMMMDYILSWRYTEERRKGETEWGSGPNIREAFDMSASTLPIHINDAYIGWGIMVWL
jgi:hypothetical protein